MVRQISAGFASGKESTSEFYNGCTDGYWLFITVSPHIFCFESLLLYANEVTDSVEVGTLNLLALCQCILNTEVVNEAEEGN